MGKVRTQIFDNNKIIFNILSLVLNFKSVFYL